VEFRHINGPATSPVGDVRPDAAATRDTEQAELLLAGPVADEPQHFV
jgi:hypothetical protein